MGAIASHSTATSPGSWDGPANEARLPSEEGPLRAAHAWVNSSGDDDAKSSYRYPHHFVSGNGTVGAASTVACSAGIAVLNGGRGGTTIPASDRQGVYAHLSRHLRDANLNVPPLRSNPSPTETEKRMTMAPVQAETEQRTTSAPILSTILERKYTHSPVEMRNTEDGRRISGYAAIFDHISRPLGGFKEVVARSAFNKSRSDGWPKIVARFNHDPLWLLGTTEARTLICDIDERGLHYTVTPPKNLDLVREWVERGDVRASSFAFRTVEDEWTTGDGGYPIRSLTSVQLIDVAPVTDPAYEATTVGLRGFVIDRERLRAEVSSGYESLAARVGASLEEVRMAGTEDNLRKFFVRSDRSSAPKPAPKLRVFGPAAKARMELEKLRQDWE